MSIPRHDEIERYHSYLTNLRRFVDGPLSGQSQDEEYLPGTQRLEFYADKLPEHNILVQDLVSSVQEEGFGTAEIQVGASQVLGKYEAALLDKLTKHDRPGVIALIGGLGAGKTTTLSYIRRKFNEIAAAEQCDNVAPFLVADCDGLFEDPHEEEPKTTILQVLKNVRDVALDHGIAKEMGWNDRQTALASSASPQALGRLRSAFLVSVVASFARSEDPQALDLLPDHLVEFGLNRSGVLNGEVGLVQAIEEYASSNDCRSLLEGLPRRELSRDRSLLRDVIIWTLRFVMGERRESEIRPVLAIDNVDHLPSELVTDLVNQSLTLAKAIRGLTVLLPMRPSSITPTGYVGIPDYYYHYGPDCIEMLRGRISRHVLQRSRVELSADSRLEPECTFRNKPNSEELDALLVTSFVLTLMLNATRYVTDENYPQHEELVPSVHEDHRGLLRITPDVRAIVSVAETIMALTGTSARYSLALCRRFYDNIYAEGQYLAELTSRLSASRTDDVPIRLRYARTVEAILGGAVPRGIIQDVYNAFKPALHGPHYGQPSLAGIRILRYLRQQRRAQVRDIIVQMQQWGIASNASIATLNELARKERLLVWFSTNRSISDRDEDLEQYVVISEHGLRYLRAVIGNFEYMWFCFSGLELVDRGSFPRTFIERARLYSAKMNQLAKVESLQEFFYRHRAEYTGNELTGRHGERLVVLELVMGSMASLLEGAIRIVSKEGTSSTAKLKKEAIARSVESVAKLTITLQEWYDLMEENGSHHVDFQQYIEATALTSPQSLYQVLC